MSDAVPLLDGFVGVVVSKTRPHCLPSRRARTHCEGQ